MIGALPHLEAVTSFHVSPKGVTTTDLCEVAESEGHAIGVDGVVIVGVAVVVHITEVVGVAGIRRTLPPVVRRNGNNYRA